MYKTVVFDLDGTLLDTLDDIAGSVNYVLDLYGLPPRTRDEVCSFVGDGLAVLMRRAIGDRDFPYHEQALMKLKERYKSHSADKTKEYAGITPTLQALKKAGVKLAVLSNKADFVVKSLVDRYFPELFEQAVGENESAGVRKKPAPDALYVIMDKLHSTAEETVYVGDSDVDIQTAKNAGVACVSVSWGFRSKEFLKEHGATRIVDAPDELLRFCKE